MATLSTNSNDGHCRMYTTTTWADTRDGAGNYSTYSANNGAITEVRRFAARGGGVGYYIYRTFMYFDTSGISATVSSATIKFKGYGSAGSPSMIAVKSTAFGGDGSATLVSGDFDSIVGYSAGTSLAGNATDYSAAITSWSVGYNDLASTADLRSDMQNNDIVIIGFMEYTHDYLNSALTSTAYHACNGYFHAYPAHSPYIEYETVTGYGNIVIGVASANIGKVDGVATANISKVIGVE